MSNFKGFLHLVRPVNTLLCALTVVCGSIIAGSPLNYIYILFTRFSDLESWAIRTFAAALSASFILAAGNAFNDVCDLSSDSINTPNRSLPSGMVTQRSATVFAGILAVIGTGFSFPLGAAGIVVALCAVLLLFVYDIKLKGVPLVGNIVVASLGGLAFIYGGIAGNAVQRSLIPAVFAMLFHLGREIVKDAADIDGDSRTGIKTAATVWGVSAAAKIASVILIALSIIVTVPFIVGYFSFGYMILIAIGVWPVLFYATDTILRYRSHKSLCRVSFLLKAAMPAGILAVLVGFQGC